MQYFKNGKIFQGEAKFCEAMGIENGKIAWVGDNESIKNENALDLKNSLVIPTFIDSHTHPSMVAKNIDRVPCLPPLVNSIAEMIEALKKSPQNTGNPNDWIEGYGWDENVFSEGRLPTCKDIDKVSTTQPVIVYHSSYHLIVCNSKAIEIAGVDKNTKDTQKGKIGRFENGEPNGIFYEMGAINLVANKQKPDSLEDTITQVLKLGKKYDSLGVSAVADMLCLFHPYDRISIYEEAKKRGFKQKVVLYYEWGAIKKLGKKPLKREVGDIFIGGIKLFMDGSIAGRTAFMKKPYPNSNDVGMKMMDEAELLEAIEYARENHLQVAIHVMGDASIEFIVNTCKDIQPWLKDTPNIRLEHASIMSVPILKTMKDAKMSFGIAPQPIFLFSEYMAYKNNLTPDLLAMAYGMKTDDEYVLTTLSSDSPATLWVDPENLYTTLGASVNRVSSTGKDMNKKEAISVSKAIDMLSINGAKIMGLKDIGKLEKGYEASFQILDKDIFNIPSEELGNILPKEVYIKGEKVL
ncbi:amidohydrolase [Helicobacter cappadocius]|uniref:Amidohydrolase family protein n=1 Tax=Helicobacter cappadocius TaxID=3063998 RepID=A0AA90PT81_9HELI|nr:MULTISPECIES: amidohydrolase family protein [unclassified Helicobacter]MDO7252941.1 amidohydrolase family protein [Helicobacter sp. faydin-H75]MDP2539069.1 amidohydrolase family protein [Helicobacter sp. faydin-H76]